MPCFVDRPEAIRRAVYLWREFDHAPPLDMAWGLMRMRIAQAFGWQLGYIDGLAPATVAELIGFLAGMGG